MKNIVHLTRAQWNTLITTGSITVEGVTHTYDADNEYFVREDIATEITASSTNDDPAGAKAVYDAINPAKGSSIPAGGLLPNILYALGTLSGAVTISLATPADSTICNHYFFTFETGATAPTITWDASITSWMGGSAPTINSNKHYEVSVLNGVGVYMEV